MDKADVVAIAVREWPEIPWNTIVEMVLGPGNIVVKYRARDRDGGGWHIEEKWKSYTGEWPPVPEPIAWGNES